MKRTIFGILLIIGIMSVCICGAAVTKSNPLDTVKKPVSMPAAAELPEMCNQPYGLCDTAICTPMESDPTQVLCTCPVEEGVSMGMKSCSARAPVGMYQNEDKEWMIQAGAPVGQIVSTYSFLHAAPTDHGEINPNTTPEDYSGDLYIRTCAGGNWADCFDKPCFVPAADPLADVMTDRKAADYAICQCGIVTNISDYVIIGPEDPSCTSNTICQDYLWSAGDMSVMVPGTALLRAYLANHPEEDPYQAYVMNNCPNCKTCKDFAGLNQTSTEE